MRFVADDMVACLETRGRSLSFVVKGTPTVQRRHTTVWKNRTLPYHFDPSAKEKQLFAAAVRLEMESLGLTTFPYFTTGSTTPIMMDIKFVIPRQKKDLVMHPSPPHLAPNASACPTGKDVDNLLKFVMDALEKTLYTNDANVVGGYIVKCHSTNILEDVGWTEIRVRIN